MVKVDGMGGETIWISQNWLPLDQLWIGEPPTKRDYSGRYKLAWDDSCLYVLAEINDNKLVDTHEDPLLKYWDDDCLEIFVDEDASGGNHQYNHQAFAYHLSLNGKDVADVDSDSSFILLNSHVTYEIKTEFGGLAISKDGFDKDKTKEREWTKAVWEAKVRIYGPDFKPGKEKQTRKSLKKGQKIGFALAYCDNDHSPERENFMGSVPVAGEDKNRGWIDAGIFQTLILQ